jgi:hypothetical protein
MEHQELLYSHHKSESIWKWKEPTTKYIFQHMGVAVEAQWLGEGLHME